MTQQETIIVVQLGLGLCLLFSAALTQYTLSNLIAALIVMKLGVKLSLVISSAGYTTYMLGFLSLNQNSSIMWIMFSTSFIIGGVFLLIVFLNDNKPKISVGLSDKIHLGFASFCALSGVTFALMRTFTSARIKATSPWRDLKKTISLMGTVDTALLLPLYIFGGLESVLYSIVYPAALGNTKAFSMNTNVLISLSSIALGVGQIAAALPLALLSVRVTRRGVWPLIFFASLAGCLSFLLVFINIPGNASYEETVSLSFINPSVPVALVAGFLLGVCDSFVNTGFYSFVSIRYEEEAAQANSVMKFVSSMPSMAAVFAGSLVGLYWQLGFASIAAIFAVVTFVFAERRAQKVVGRFDVTPN